MSATNLITAKPTTQPMVWIVDYSAPLIETETHDAVALPTRDRDGRFAPNFDKPVTRKQAMRKLEASSRKAVRGMDMLAAMESW